MRGGPSPSSARSHQIRQCVPLTSLLVIVTLQVVLLVVFLRVLHSASPSRSLLSVSPHTLSRFRSWSVEASYSESGKLSTGCSTRNSSSSSGSSSTDSTISSSGSGRSGGSSSSIIAGDNNEDDPPPFPPPERAVVAWFVRRYWSMMDEAAARCGLKRSRHVAWHDSLAGVSNQDRVTRADYPGIAGAFFDTAFDFRFVRSKTRPPFSSDPACRHLRRGNAFSLLRQLPLVQQPPKELQLQSPWVQLAPNELQLQPPWVQQAGSVEGRSETGDRSSSGVSQDGGQGAAAAQATVEADSRQLRAEEEAGEADSDALKLIAIVFPQFHPCKENDQFWGANFTEWDNLKRAFFNPTTFRPVAHPIGPHFSSPLSTASNTPHPPPDASHKIPHTTPISHPISSLAGGYYNFLSRSHRRRTSALARAYGFHGLCYHHYWFGCRRTVLAEPLLRMLEDGEPNMPFCLIWANEPWTNRWDGAREGSGMLLDQTYGDEKCWRNHFNWLLKFFKHPNYIKVSGRPMFGIYQLGDVPEPQARGMFDLWHSLARQHGFPGLHLFMCLVHTQSSPNQRGSVQAVAEYEPNYRNFLFGDTPSPVRLHPNHYRGSYVAWDNFPRHSTDLTWRLGDVAEDPVRLTARLEARMRLARQDIAEDRSRFGPNGTAAAAEPGSELGPADGAASGTFFFVAAWNEWGEGNALEPNHIFGFGNLNAVARAYARSRHPATEPQHVLQRLAGAAVACGVCLDVRYYVDMDERFSVMLEGRVNQERERLVKHFVEIGFGEGKQFRLRRRGTGEEYEKRGAGRGDGSRGGKERGEVGGGGGTDGVKGEEEGDREESVPEWYEEFTCFARTRGTGSGTTAGLDAAAAGAGGAHTGRDASGASNSTHGCKWLTLPLDYVTVAYLVEEGLI